MITIRPITADDAAAFLALRAQVDLHYMSKVLT